MKMKKFMYSEFYNEICEILKSLDYSMVQRDINGNRDIVNEHLKNLRISKLALKVMFNKTYLLTRTTEYIGLVNEEDETDFLIKMDAYKK